jgi:hypothetical protein
VPGHGGCTARDTSGDISLTWLELFVDGRTLMLEGRRRGVEGINLGLDLGLFRQEELKSLFFGGRVAG